MRIIKRLLDVVLALGLLALFWPLGVLLCLANAVFMGRPLFFRQQRPGLNGEPFELIKFRTMRSTLSGEDALATDALRLTRWGRFLRSTSLDELPELWNIVKGDMSFVGPRPLLMEYMDRYTSEQNRRHEVQPGLTGWAQVLGRNSVDWETRFEYDIWYVDHWSLLLDLKIMWMTVGVVLGRGGVAAQGHVSMPEFKGKEKA